MIIKTDILKPYEANTMIKVLLADDSVVSDECKKMFK